jgi:protein-disulfide isomerase
VPTPVAATGSGGSRGTRTRASQRAAEIRREAAAADQRRRNLVATFAVAGALLAVVLVGTSVQAGRDLTGTTSRVPAGTVDTYAFAYGAKSPSTVVDVYEDFMCPYCGQFEKLSKGLVQQYAGRGVQFRYHVIAFLDRASTTQYSTRAANALGVVLDTAGPGAAKKFHDELYAQQPAEGSAGLSDAKLVQLAVQAGAKQSAVQQGIDDREFAHWVLNATDAASKAGVNGTPTLLVDGARVGGADIPSMVQELSKELASATSS